MRAGPLSDERIIRLANRRFISHHFDLFNGSFLYDEDAKAWVREHLPKFDGRSVPTPPVVFISPDGQMLGRVSNYASAETMLGKMLDVLEQHPEQNRPSTEEAALKTPVERANVLIDLQRLDDARELLATVDSSEAHYVLGRLARFDRDWVQMAEHFAQVRDDALTDDMRLERAYQHWEENDFDELCKALEDFPEKSNRYTEARYYLGLAKYHQGDIQDALNLWKQTIDTCTQDPWIYRSDWAHSQILSGDRKSFSTSGQTGKKESPLGRLGYMGVKQPDLRPRK